MIGACGWSCTATYFFSLTDQELLILLVCLAVVVPMFMTICHEAGHYYAGKLSGVGCKRFALGMGPAVLRLRIPAEGCDFVLGMLPAGGRVTYDDRYWKVSHIRRAFMSAAGWLADIAIALLIGLVVNLTKATGPIVTVVTTLAYLRVACALLPITGDCKHTVTSLWLAATERA